MAEPALLCTNERPRREYKHKQSQTSQGCTMMSACPNSHDPVPSLCVRIHHFKRTFIPAHSYHNFLSLSLSLSLAEPLPLMDLCRRAARLALGRERLQEIESLPLPQSLKNYLQYQWLIPAEPTGRTGTQTQSSERWIDKRNDWENQEGMLDRRMSAKEAQPLCRKWISEEVERETSTSLFWNSISLFIRLLTGNEWLMMVTPSVSHSSRKKSHPPMAQCGEEVAPPSDENKKLRRGSTHTSDSLEAFLTHLVTISLLLDTIVCNHGPTSTGGRLQSPDGRGDFSANVYFLSDWLGARPKAHITYRDNWTRPQGLHQVLYQKQSMQNIFAGCRSTSKDSRTLSDTEQQKLFDTQSYVKVCYVTQCSLRWSGRAEINDMKEDKGIGVEFSIYFALINTCSPPPPTHF